MKLVNIGLTLAGQYNLKLYVLSTCLYFQPMFTAYYLPDTTVHKFLKIGCIAYQ